MRPVADEELSPVFREQRKQNPVQRWAWGISTGELTLPALLRQAGYRTALVGKWHLGYDYKFHPMNYGFTNSAATSAATSMTTPMCGPRLEEVDWWKDKKIQNEPGYTTDLLARYATDFIGETRISRSSSTSRRGVHSPRQLGNPSRKTFR